MTERVVGTPSATLSMLARTSASFWPLPIRSPTVRLRPSGLTQVVIRSPSPARPAKVLGLRAHRHAQAGDLDQPAGDQGGLGVVAGRQAVEDAGGDGDDVLGRPGQLDADRVGVGVDAEPLGGERRLHPPGQRLVGRRRHRGRRADIARSPPRCSARTAPPASECAPASDPRRTASAQHVGDDLRRPQQRLVLDPLGDGDDRHAPPAGSRPGASRRRACIGSGRPTGPASRRGSSRRRWR